MTIYIGLVLFLKTGIFRLSYFDSGLFDRDSFTRDKTIEIKAIYKVEPNMATIDSYKKFLRYLRVYLTDILKHAWRLDED